MKLGNTGRCNKKTPWMERLKWPLYCFVAVAFWNMLGAGVFGFLINPPISLYYIQGLNTTAVHAHAALFGVYGFLALGFVFLIARYLRPDTPFNDKLMKWGLLVIKRRFSAHDRIKLTTYRCYPRICKYL